MMIDADFAELVDDHATRGRGPRSVCGSEGGFTCTQKTGKNRYGYSLIVIRH